MNHSYYKKLELIQFFRQVQAESIATIMSKLRATGERELPANTVGEMVMHQLRKLDDVAYVRFASVYRRFKDVNEFRATIESMEDKADPS